VLVAVDVAVLALAVVAGAVGALDDAGSALGLVAVAVAWSWSRREVDTKMLVAYLLRRRRRDACRRPRRRPALGPGRPRGRFRCRMPCCCCCCYCRRRWTDACRDGSHLHFIVVSSTFRARFPSPGWIFWPVCIRRGGPGAQAGREERGLVCQKS